MVPSRLMVAERVLLSNLGSGGDGTRYTSVYLYQLCVSSAKFSNRQSAGPSTGA